MMPRKTSNHLAPCSVGYVLARDGAAAAIVHRHLSAPNVLAIVPVDKARLIANEMFAREGLTARVQGLLAAVGASAHFGGCV